MLSTAIPVKMIRQKNILAVSVDHDGCYCYLQNGQIVDHRRFHQFLLKQIQQGGYDEVALLVGSLRQNRDTDVYIHTVHNLNGSITQTLPQLQESLQQAAKIPVNLITWLLEDVVLGFSAPEQFNKHKDFVKSRIPEGSLIPYLPRHLSGRFIGDREASHFTPIMKRLLSYYFKAIF